MTATAAPAGTDPRQRPTSLMLRWSVVPNLVLAPLVAVVAALVVDLAAGVSVLLGALLSVVVFVVGIVAVGGLLSGPGAGAMAGAFLVLFVQLGLTVGAFVLVDRSGWLDTVVVGVAFVVVGVVFQIGLAVGALRARVTLGSPGPGDGSLRRNVKGDREVSQ